MPNFRQSPLAFRSLVIGAILLCATLAFAQIEDAGSALSFDGVDDEAFTDPFSGFYYPLTLTAWVKTSQNLPSVSGIMGKYVNGSLNGYSVFLYNGRVRAFYFRDSTNYVWDGTQGLDGGPIADGEWHHLAFVVDATGGRLYVDGSLKAGRGWTGTPGATSAFESFRIGHFSNDALGFLKGEIDQVTIWKTALNQTTLQRIRHFVFAGSETGLELSWNLNEGSGISLTNAAFVTIYGNTSPDPNWIASTAPIGPAPTARTIFPIIQTGGNATLRSQLNPRGAEATAFFEYGLTTSYGSTTAATLAGTDTNEALFAQAVSGLAPNTTYHYRVVVTNEFGRIDGADVSFNSSTPFGIYQELDRAVLGDPAWGDYDNDGDLDLLARAHPDPSNGLTRDVVIFRNDGGVFTELLVTPISNYYTKPAWIDYDHDGNLDIAVLDKQAGSRIYRNDGGDVFTALDVGLPSADAAAGSSWGDYDNDGDLDLFLNPGDYFMPPTIYQNDGGSFTPLPFDSAYSQGVLLKSAAWADYDNDGDLDLVSVHTGPSRIFRNFNGVLTDIQAPLPTSARPSVLWGDYNGDGLLDLFTAGFDATTFSRNTGAGQFVPSGISLPLLQQPDADLGDYDNDGDLDLLLGGQNDNFLNSIVRLYRNDANTYVDANIGLANGNAPGFAWGDFDGDGGLDFAFAGNDMLTIYRKTTAANTPPTAPTSLTTTQYGSRTDFHWAASSDPSTATVGLTYNMRVGTTPGGQEIMAGNSDLVTGRRRSVGRGNVGYGQDHFLNLPPGTYYWSVQAVDSGYLGGPFSTEGSFTVLPPMPNECGPVNALHFDGVDDYVQMANPNAGANALPITITAWVRTTQSTGAYPGLVTKYTGSSANGWALTLNAGRVAPWYYKNGTSFVEPGFANASDRFIADGQWHHIAFAVDATSSRTYIDGVLTNTQSWSGGTPGPATTGEPVRLGVYFGGAGKFFAGDLDEVTIWNYALSQEEINAIRPACLTGRETGLVAQWNLNEASGTSVADHTGHSFTGTLINGVAHVASTAAISAPLVRTVIPQPVAFQHVGYFNGKEAGALINPQGSPTTAWFEYGTSTSYGNITPAADVGSGNSFVAFNYFISGLAPSTLYHIRAVAMNQFGQIFGLDQTFTTPGYLATTTTRSGTLDLTDLTLADITGDDLLDLLHSGRSDSSDAQTLGTTGPNPIGPTNWSDTPGLYRGSIAAGDFDNDGDIDLFLSGLATTDNSGRSFLRANTTTDPAAWTFNNMPHGIPAFVDGAAAWGDFDNDGDLDLAVSGASGATRYCRVYRNDAGVLNVIAADLTGVSNGSLAWGDFDNDGDLDLLVTGSTTGNTTDGSTRLYRNNGGVFVNISTALPNTAFGDAQWCDYDLDGDLDLAISGFSSGAATARIFRNDSGVLVLAANLPGLYRGRLAWGDFDNDGYPDLLICGTATGADSDAATRIYRNIATGGTFADLGLSLTGVTDGDVSWADIDANGTLEPALGGRTASGNRITYTGQSRSIPNNPPNVPANLVAIPQCDRVAFSWDAATDAETVASGLTYSMRVGTTPGGTEIMSPGSNPETGARRLLEMGNVQLGTTAWLRLKPGTYYWSVQAIDAAFAGSPFAPEQAFTVTSLPLPRITQTSRPTANQFFLRFTACPGLGFIVQRSNGLTSWTDLGPATETNPGTYEFLDPAASSPFLFYRARQQ